MPSMVVISAPSAWAASTVQAPQFDVSHPTCVPVSPRRSRSRWTRSSRGSTSSSCRSPLTVTATGTVLIPLLSRSERRSDRDPIQHRLLVQRPRTPAVRGRPALKEGRYRDDHTADMHRSTGAIAEPPVREVLVARQPVLDADMNLLGFELLVDGAAVVVDALSEIGLETLTGDHAAWLPLGGRLLSEVGPLPVRSDRVVLQVPADEPVDAAVVEALRQLAGRGACIVLDRFAYRVELEPLL